MSSSSQQRGLRLKSESKKSWRARCTSQEDLRRRSSTGDEKGRWAYSSSASEDNLLNTPSAHDNLEDTLKEHMHENLFLTQEVLDLKMRLASALAQIDAEKHTNRLQSEQISNLSEDNEDLKHEIGKACQLIADMERQKKDSDDKKGDSTSGWIDRVKSNIGLVPSQSCAQSETALMAKSPSTASLSTRRPSIFTTSTRRLSLLASDLAGEEVTFSSKNERRGSIFSSLSSFQEGGDMGHACNEKDQDDCWLDTNIILNPEPEKKSVAARRA
eukprot:CAMPEP_0181046848 /NCGR_PEP_ID=MMETSP1070-20121207/14562_1 /TAXON_ID=265543 /ORGANISM="Minutocellus polymorphus, Strain NH13" /LENGTH=271 /DNA_ID=CAMNT_0023125475 /DNA_START=54 /DNA_END=869 /DNA_ORIENTATION=-